ncbi:glycosyltransferase [Flavihumibacter sp. R14]|nr:glycosyltransferase [Flavihumibacter soli]
MSVSKLCEELVKGGQDLEVFTTTANGGSELNVEPGKKKIIEGVPVTYFRRITGDPYHLSPALLWILWRRLSYKWSTPSSQIVHIHAWWNFASVGSCIIALLLSKPVILSPRGTLSNYSFGNRKSLLKNLFHSIIGKSLLERCHFHVTSEKESEDLNNLLKPQSTTIISNFIQLLKDVKTGKEILPEEQTVNQEKPIKLIFLSRIEEKKGLNVLFYALSDLQIPFDLTIAGTGNPEYIKSLKELAAKLNLSENLCWVGQLNHRTKFEMLATHDLMILPSFDESFANVVVESLSVGTPVLLSKKVGLSDYITAKNLGWVYDETKENLTEGISRAALQTENRKRIRREAPIRISLDFDDKYLLAQYVEMYKSLMNS